MSVSQSVSQLQSFCLYLDQSSQTRQQNVLGHLLYFKLMDNVDNIPFFSIFFRYGAGKEGGHYSRHHGNHTQSSWRGSPGLPERPDHLGSVVCDRPYRPGTSQQHGPRICARAFSGPTPQTRKTLVNIADRGLWLVLNCPGSKGTEHFYVCQKRYAAHS